MLARRTSLLALAFLVILSGCSDLSMVREALQSQTPHEAYTAALSESGVLNTTAGQRWYSLSESILEEAGLVTVPIQEVAYLSPERPSALAYRFSARRGESLSIDVARAQADSSRLFVDLFMVPNDTSRALELAAASTEPTDSLQTLTLAVRRDTEYILRVQPELLEGGQITTTVATGASLHFPVDGRDGRAIQSFFGDPRAGGARQHEGVDIFAPRGTPVVSASRGRVTRVNETHLGGKVVWVRDDRERLSHYYAHLDSQMVRPGQRVQPGDTLGLVGNTGNARSTPPHLHYGIYSGGAVDPYPFVYNVHTEIIPPDTPLDRIGMNGRIAAQQANVRRGPGTSFPVVVSLPQHTLLQVKGSTGRWHRVLLPDESMGFIASHLLEDASSPLPVSSLATDQVLSHRPGSASLPVGSVSADSAIEVLGHFEDYSFVRTENGDAGWIPVE